MQTFFSGKFTFPRIIRQTLDPQRPIIVQAHDCRGAEEELNKINSR